MRVPIGGNDWAEITPVEDLRRIDRRAVNATIVYEGTSDGRPILKASMDDDMATACLVHVCTDWSLQFPPPSVDAASLDKLTLEQDDELRKAIEPHLSAIRGRQAPTPDNETPTPGSVS